MSLYGVDGKPTASVVPFVIELEHVRYFGTGSEVAYGSTECGVLKFLWSECSLIIIGHGAVCRSSNFCGIA